MNHHNTEQIKTQIDSEYITLFENLNTHRTKERKENYCPKIPDIDIFDNIKIKEINEYIAYV